MKKLLTILGVLCAIGELLEYLALPALFAILGIWQQLPWQYYAITIGGYFAILLAGELVIRWIFRALGKTYSSRIAGKFKKLVDRIELKQEKSDILPPQEN